MRFFTAALILATVASAQATSEVADIIIEPVNAPELIVAEKEAKAESEIKILEGKPLDYEFASYTALLGKVYTTMTEYEMRKQNFAEIDHFVRKHNADKTQTYLVGHNHLSDLTAAERSQRLGLKQMPKDAKNVEQKSETEKSDELVKTGSIDSCQITTGNGGINSYTQSYLVPDSKDWRDEGAVSPIQDQGLCGSCWTFMTNAVLEGAYQIKNGGGVFNLSEQQILDCSTKCFDTCSGGTIYDGYEFSLNNYSVLDKDYPYTSGTSRTIGSCQDLDATPVKTKLWTQVESKEGELTRRAIAESPVGVAINGGDTQFMQYKSGIFSCDTCGYHPSALNHAVTLVGYGTEDGTDYFILKNQWGTVWGDQGYMKIKNDGKGYGQVGINNYPTYVDVESGAAGASSQQSLMTYGAFITTACATLLLSF